MKLKTKVVKFLPNGNFRSHSRLSRQRVRVLSRLEKPVIILIALFYFILTSSKPCFKLVVLKQLFVKSSDLRRRMRARAPCLQSNGWSYYAGFSSSESSKAKMKRNSFLILRPPKPRNVGITGSLSSWSSLERSSPIHKSKSQSASFF